MNRLPVWFKQAIPDAEIFRRLDMLSSLRINTVCVYAKCPNLNSCFSKGRLTFMILGNRCSRGCLFCGVAKSRGDDLGLDFDEPRRISQLILKLGLRYVVITSVTRDDLIDGGASQFARTKEEILTLNPDIKVEFLIPDFKGNISAIRVVVESRPDVLGHNLETVRRLHKELKPYSDYELSLNVLSQIKHMNPRLITKSALILGLGESESEVISAMEDLKKASCDILTLGQYLSPSPSHYPAQEFISPDKFNRYLKIANELNFKVVAAGPLVRSSWQAEELYNQAKEELCMTL